MQTSDDTFICQVIGDPLPIHIAWLAHNSTTNEVMELSNRTEHVFITQFMAEMAVSSELRLPIKGIFHSPICRTGNGNGLIVDQQEFILAFIGKLAQEAECDTGIIIIFNYLHTGTSDTMVTDLTPITEENVGSKLSIPVYAVVVIAIFLALLLPFTIVLSVLIYRRCCKTKKKIPKG